MNSLETLLRQPIDLSLIRDEDVLTLDAPRQECLIILIDAIKARELSEAKRNAATARVCAAQEAEAKWLAAASVAKPTTFLEIRHAAIAAYNLSH